MEEKVKIHTDQDIQKRSKRKYKQGENQTIWDRLDELQGQSEADKDEIIRLKEENKKLKEKLNGISA